MQRKKKETRKSDKKLPKENHDSVDQVLFKWLVGIQSQKYESRKKNSCYTFASIFSIYLVRFRCASYLKPAKLEWSNNGGVFTMYKVDALEEFLSFSAFSKKKKKIFQTFGITKFFSGPLGDIDCIYNAHVHRWIQHPVKTPKMERFSKPLLALSYFRKTLHLRCLTGLPNASARISSLRNAFLG